MARKLKITEEQAQMLMAEGITLTADVAATNGNLSQAVANTKQQARNSGINLDDANIQIKASDTNESRIVDMKNLRENRIRALRAKGQSYTVRDFLGKL